MSLPDEEVGVAHHPVAVDARVVGDHVAGRRTPYLEQVWRRESKAPHPPMRKRSRSSSRSMPSFGIGVACKVLDHLAGA